MINNNHEINLSAHGYERLLERTHCKTKEVISHLNKIWDEGKTLSQYDKKSPIYKYLQNTKNAGGEDREIRVKGNTLYIFNRQGTAFITCFEIAQKIIQDKGARRRKVYFN